MAILPIILTPEPVLRETAKPVDTITDELLSLLDDMADTMYDAPGIGLAANQIGRLERVIVMDCAKDGSAPELWKMINPEIITSSAETAKLEEGCLSIPGHNSDVVRPAEVEVRYLGTDGNMHEMQADGLLAACVQHEIDHLNGVLFIDHLSRLKRDMIWRKVLKEAKARI
jgi:peptide deformylase